MKTTFKTLLAAAVTLGVMAPAAFAKDFVVDQNRYDQHQMSMKQSSYNRMEPASGCVPGRFSGSSAYEGSLAGQVAVQTDPIGDGDGRAFTVHPVRGARSEFNSTLRYGDTSQSRATRFNQAFNN